MHRYLSKSYQLKERQRFAETVDSIKAKFTGDPRMQIDGHHFTALLTWYIGQIGVPAAFQREDTVHRALFGCLEHVRLAKEPLFQALLERVPT